MENNIKNWKNQEQEIDDIRTKFCANRARIRQITDMLFVYDDPKQPHLVAELLMIIHKETWNDRHAGESIFYLAMQEIFPKHKEGMQAFDQWIENIEDNTKIAFK